jgi:hypothetical protein
MTANGTNGVAAGGHLRVVGQVETPPPAPVSAVELGIAGRAARTLTPWQAVLMLLPHCSPAELQHLKLTGIREVQRAFPVQVHDASECPG